MPRKAWMDRAHPYVQNTLTDHAQKWHESGGNNMNIWHKNKDRARTS